MVQDPYDQETVYVAESKIPFAGEGLFAKRKISQGELVCLFNGVKCNKIGHTKVIRSDSPEWSDYRLTLDKDIDIDIPSDCTSLLNYCATLGHKACHSFKDKNAAFDDIYHPR